MREEMLDIGKASHRGDLRKGHSKRPIPRDKELPGASPRAASPTAEFFATAASLCQPRQFPFTLLRTRLTPHFAEHLIRVLSVRGSELGPKREVQPQSFGWQICEPGHGSGSGLETRATNPSYEPELLLQLQHGRRIDATGAHGRSRRRRRDGGRRDRRRQTSHGHGTPGRDAIPTTPASRRSPPAPPARPRRDPPPHPRPPGRSRVPAPHRAPRRAPREFQAPARDAAPIRPPLRTRR